MFGLIVGIGIGIIVGFVGGGMWMCALHDAIQREQGPPVRWSPEEYEIIKRQSK